MVRLKDIALQAGVSVMTVSRVLRDARDISPATKARVRAIATQMGYVPDVMAQGLRTRSTRLFGLVVPTLTDPVFARVAAALEDQAHELGYDLLIAHSLNQPEREELAIRRLLAHRVEGLFLAPVYRLAPTAPVYGELRRRSAKVVLLGHKAPFCHEFVNVETDDIAGAAAATRHLLALGHRRIAFLAGPAGSPSAQERFEGYRRALREAQLDLDEQLIFTAGAMIEDGVKGTLQMLHEAAHATAVQAVNDLVAVGTADTLLRQGFRIPEDISIVGFGNLPLSQFFQVPLTTVQQAKYRLGLVAMQTMLKLLRGEAPMSHRFPADLILRASTAAPPPVPQPPS